ncbi:MAG: hypothetical protein ACOCUT_01555 [bacterium]
MNSKTTKSFWKYYNKLPKHIKKAAKSSFIAFQENPNNPGLYFKAIFPKERVYSIRISQAYRALGNKEYKTIKWFWIGNHNDYEKMINRL